MRSSLLCPSWVAPPPSWQLGKGKGHGQETCCRQRPALFWNSWRWQLEKAEGFAARQLRDSRGSRPGLQACFALGLLLRGTAASVQADTGAKASSGAAVGQEACLHSLLPAFSSSSDQNTVGAFPEPPRYSEPSAAPPAAPCMALG